MKPNIFTLCLFVFFFVFALFVFDANAQTARSRAGGKTTVSQLKNAYFKRDFEACAKTGQNFYEYIDVEAKAWTISCQARIADERENALTQAKKLADANPQNAWAQFALANALYFDQKSKDALPVAEKALALAPANEELIFLKAQILSQLRRYDESGIFLEQNASKIKDKSRVAYSLALILYNRSRISTDKIDEPTRKQSFDKFAEAVKLDPRSVNANYLYGYYLNLDKRYAESYPLLKKAVALAPQVLDIRREYWKSINNQPDFDQAKKNAQIETDIDGFLRAQKNSPSALAAVSKQYADAKNVEKQKFYEDQILQKYADTKYAEDVSYNRIQAFEAESAKAIDPAKMMEMLAKMSSGNTDILKSKEFTDFSKQNAENQNKLKAMRWDYIKRPRHFDERKLGDVYFSLLKQVSFDRTVTDEQFNDLVAQSLRYKKSPATNVNSEIAEILSRSKTPRPNDPLTNDAEKYARAGIVEAEDKINELSKSGMAKETLDNRARILRSQAKNTLGVVLSADKKYDEAEKALLESVALNSENRSALNSLASLYEAQKMFDKAEEYHLKNATGGDLDKGIFSRFYKNRNGSLEGFDVYYAGIKEKIHARAKEKVFASRIAKPKDAAPFSLQTIDGKTISSADLKGKIIVVNLWGTWCAPCVIEMPQLQQLYKKYENDKDVAIVTMDTNDEPETVKKFIADKKYEFPVMLGDSYTGNIIFDGGIAFPTTLFIDKQGKVSFIKVGRTENLLEEFDWRIEALKNDK